MFCPKCSQQSSEEVRFCPRCGLSLAGLPAYMAANEFAAVQPVAPRPPEMTARRRDMRRGAKLMFFSAFLFPVFLALGLAVDEPAPLLIPLFTFLAGLALVLYARLFADNTMPVGTGAARTDLGAAGDRAALGAPPFVPASLFNQQKRANTAEIYQPPSVTENTTKLLDKDS